MTLFNDPQQRKAGFKLALFGCALAVMVLGLGAFTRLVDAGLGCPDWPTCYGHVLWPGTAEEVSVANQAFPDMPVMHDKTWPEMVHRYFAQSLGFIVIGLYIIALRQQKNQQQPRRLVTTLLALNIVMTVAVIIYGVVLEPFAVATVAASMLTLAYFGLVRGTSEQPYKLPAFILAFIILQGLFGMWTVTLKLWPQVVTSHLLGGFTTLGLLWLLTLRYNNLHWQLPAAAFSKLRRLRGWVLLGLVVVTAQIALGGWTTSNYAAVACPDLPTCQAQWLPEMDFAQGFNFSQGIGPNYLGGLMTNEARIAIHFSHRVGALVTTVLLIFIAIALYRQVAVTEAKTMAKVLSLVLALQISLGLANVLFNFPVAVAVAHNLVGAILLLTMITLNYKVFTAQMAGRDGR
jgi:cytochrome c oxidase assembly protein subunit 15